MAIQGDLLKLMRLDFVEAKADAPSIIFVDELDSFGNRESFDHDNKSYFIQMVHAFLECLDGAGGREGVVVIGATNNPSDIDPAIRRAGRQFAIPLPGANDRIGW
ncbi:AAA family ATPase [Rhizobium ruizarguesonis]|uniref:AAA family ATPase n=1 Tax=Rhizobium ruizarguesonis TaxID=2081791 RepID=UPI0019E4D7AE|nr:AAA family ATPase [Rhizobium leguminosarum bv. viciae]